MVRIGTRASKLALAQAGMMQRAIAAALGAPPEAAEEVAPLIHITTSGDRIQDRRLLEVGGKGLFTKEIEEALLDGRIDCAIHSLKDMPAELPPGLAIAATPAREDVRDAFLSERWSSLEDLPEGARVGTASLRRQAQVLHRRPDIEVTMLRGNVDTRLAKLAAGEADAILLAAAGLSRLGLSHLPKGYLDPVDAPPAPGQGALAIETRAEDQNVAWAVSLRDAAATLEVAAERGAMLALEGSCKTAIGAHARVAGSRLTLVVEALVPDGSERFRAEGVAEDVDAAAARALGLALGQQVLRLGGARLQLDDR